MVVAPELGNLRSQEKYVYGKVHRDDVDTIEPGYLTMLVAVTDVTLDNGSVTVWPGTQLVPCNPKHRKVSIRDRRGSLLVGKAGTVWIFDSRLLHQSNPNVTDQTRLMAQVLICTEGVIAPVIEV